MSLLKNKQGKAKELGLGGAILMVIIGIILLSSSGNDSSGVLSITGLIFLIVGGIATVGLLIPYFK